jgi:hypothetical protein
VRLAGFPDRIPYMMRMVGWHVDLVAELAGEADTEYTGRNTGGLPGAPGHERKGVGGEIDTLADPDGIGVYGFPTDILPAEQPAAPNAIRGAYLTAKRLRKGNRERRQWDHIRALAEQDPATYRSSLEASFGSVTARRIANAVEQGSPPEKDIWRRASVALSLRRLRDPRRALAIIARSAGRIVERVSRPTGLYVVVAGPDGTGKSTLVGALPDACAGPFRTATRFHWRPQLLPRLGALTRSDPSDPNRPHARSPHGRLVSAAALTYYWADFLLGSWLSFWPRQVRSGLVVLERGWWDVLVDPRRYRLQVPRALVRALGYLLPTPDLTLVLEGPAGGLPDRKGELPQEEFARQTAAWREVLPGRASAEFLDACRTQEEVMEAARDTIFSRLEERAVARLGDGWVGLPIRRPWRWIVPRGPRKAARTGLSVYQPVTPRGRAGWEIARLASLTGACRLFTRGPGPPPEVREALAPHLHPGATVAVMTANYPGRYVALVIGRDGNPQAVAKVAADDQGRHALHKEALALLRFSSKLPSGLAAPRLLDHADGLLLLEAICWRARARTWQLPREVARGLGAFFRATAHEREAAGAAHGDCAPWNLLCSGDRWVLVDWEQAEAAAPPFFDIFHYLVQAHVLLRRRPPGELLDDCKNLHGNAGAALVAYAEGAGVSARDALGFLPAYLEASRHRCNPDTPSGRAGLRARRELLRTLGRRG